LLFKLAFGLLGAASYSETDANMFSDLIFAKNSPFMISVSIFLFAVFVIIPVVVRSSLMAKYFIYIGGMCEVPCNYFTGVVFPWIVAAILSHMEIYFYLINWAALTTCIYVQFVCPLFMWSKSVKESKTYEENYRQSVKMILDVENK
jgi:hypothetical protein